MRADAAAERHASPVRELLHGSLPPNVALMHLLSAATSAGEIDAMLARMRADLERGDSSRAGSRLAEIERLWQSHPNALAMVQSVLDGLDHSPGLAGEKSPDYWRAGFDRAAAISPDAGVALYTLGNAELAAQATDEIVRWLLGERILRPDSRVLDFGCGAGRVLRALAPHVRFVTGSDVSEGMLRQACATAAPNAAVVRTSGRDLKCFREASFDCVLAVDSFPYLVLSGSDLARVHLAEFARVLGPAGTVAIFNYSYRGSLESDARDLSAFAADYGLSIDTCGERPFMHWDGAAFVLRRASASASNFVPNAALKAAR